ncbi:hypothetical protein C8Q76DRAFT_641490 [Earliella scabrosa]|nr:hypothetical protein C8Q76DRAFT_641490 [Earliella scabrosa]
MVLYYAPISGCYAIIRIDPVATLKPFKYSDLVAQAETMSTRKYLVFLEQELSIPGPRDPWYPHSVTAIGPHLPPQVDEKGKTTDMGTPIFPNSKHPRNRPPVHVVPQFPFANCYHWSSFEEIIVRILPRPEEFDDDHAFRLPAEECLKLWAAIGQDTTRMKENLAKREAASESTQPVLGNTTFVDSPLDQPSHTHISRSGPAAPEQHPTTHPTAADHHSLREGLGSKSYLPDEKRQSFHSSSGYSSPNFSVISEDSDPPMDTNPIVELWLELTEHLTEEEIPSPEELYRERDAVAALVMTAIQRLEEENIAKATRNADYDAAQSIKESSNINVKLHSRRHTRWSISHIIQSLKAKTRRAAVRIVYHLRLPYIAVWP